MMEVNQDSQRYNAKNLSIIALQSAAKNLCRTWISLKVKSKISAKDDSTERKILINYHEPHRIILARSTIFFEFQRLSRYHMSTFFKSKTGTNRFESELRFLLWLCFENRECQSLIIDSYEVKCQKNLQLLARLRRPPAAIL